MSELSRYEALVELAVEATVLFNCSNRSPAECVRQAARDARPEIRTALAGGGGGGKAERAFWEEVRRRDNEVVKYLTELGAANTAFHAGWVSRADHRALESRLAAAEKRAEEAEREGASDRAKLLGALAELRAERDALKAELAEAKKEHAADRAASHVAVASLGFERSKNDALKAELDAALARVKELEASLGRIRDVWLATDVKALVSALSTMKASAGAQP